MRITAGSSATLTDNTISQNLVQGTGAPARGAATNNVSLRLGAGVRLIGAGASVFSRNNITDNAYGVFNVQLDGTTANTAVPVKAENNWWGLRTGAVAANAGPAISPTTNPPAPENPVNGAAIADGTGNTSDAVDFFPFRNGFQSDPNTGEFPVLDVPGPVNDARADGDARHRQATTYHRGDTRHADRLARRRLRRPRRDVLRRRRDRRRAPPRSPTGVDYTIPSDVLLHGAHAHRAWSRTRPARRPRRDASTDRRIAPTDCAAASRRPPAPERSRS